MHKIISKSFKKLLSVVLIAGLVLGAAGCGKGTGGSAGTGGQGGTGDQAAGNQKMGRYMETEYDLSEFLSRASSLTKMDDGSLAIFDYNTGLHVSADGGKTWESKQQDWYDETQGDNYLMSAALSPKGDIAYVVSIYMEEEDDELHPEFYYVPAGGEKMKLDISYTPENYDYITDYYFSPDGKLYGAALGGAVYEINTEDGSSQAVYQAPDNIRDMVFLDGKILLCTYEDVIVYDILSKEPDASDSVLKDFILNETPSDRYAYSDAKELLMTTGETADTLYLVFDKGLYRYENGNDVTEQLIDGTLCTLGDPSVALVGMLALPNEEFLILYSNGKLIHYVYDETVSSVPETTVTAYSLQDNNLMRQAIMNYQKKNPNVYVKYEIGMVSDSGVTREDALKKLNTEIMAGKGPDILILDGMPADSYIEKGILADITPYLEGMDLLDNIMDVYQEEGKTYMLPARFSIMMMAGNKDILAGIQDLKTLADETEALREKYPEGSLFRFYSEKVALMSLLQNDMPALMAQDGSVDTEKLTEFLTQAKRIYQAEVAGIEQEERESYTQRMNEASEEELQYFLDVSINSFSLLTGECRMSVGSLGDFDWSLSSLVSLKNIEDGFDLAPYHGMTENVFRPNTIAALNAKSEYLEIAGEVLKMLFSEETLSGPVGNGFAINEAALKNSIDSRNGKDGELFGAMSSTDVDGNMVTLDMRGASQEEIDFVMNLIKQASVSGGGYEVIENAVYELGPDALNGTKSIEDCVSEIMKKVAIYLAE